MKSDQTKKGLYVVGGSFALIIAFLIGSNFWSKPNISLSTNEKAALVVNKNVVQKEKVASALQTTLKAMTSPTTPAESEKAQEAKVILMTINEGYYANAHAFYSQPGIREETMKAREDLKPVVGARFGDQMTDDYRSQVLGSLDTFMESSQNPMTNPFADASQQQNSLASHSVESITD